MTARVDRIGTALGIVGHAPSAVNKVDPRAGRINAGGAKSGSGQGFDYWLLIKQNPQRDGNQSPRRHRISRRPSGKIYISAMGIDDQHRREGDAAISEPGRPRRQNAGAGYGPPNPETPVCSHGTGHRAAGPIDHGKAGNAVIGLEIRFATIPFQRVAKSGQG